MRAVNADDLIHELDKDGIVEHGYVSVFGIPIIEDCIPVVRCKDCKHKDVLPDVYGIGKEALYCHAIKHYVVHDFFCKYGEKVTK